MTCEPCGGSGDVCCSGNTCNGGLGCANPGGGAARTCMNCGATGAACCAGNICQPGGECTMPTGGAGGAAGGTAMCTYRLRRSRSSVLGGGTAAAAGTGDTGFRCRRHDRAQEVSGRRNRRRRPRSLPGLRRDRRGSAAPAAGCMTGACTGGAERHVRVAPRRSFYDGRMARRIARSLTVALAALAGCGHTRRVPSPPPDLARRAPDCSARGRGPRQRRHRRCGRHRTRRSSSGSGRLDAHGARAVAADKAGHDDFAGELPARALLPGQPTAGRPIASSSTSTTPTSTRWPTCATRVSWPNTSWPS